jgi:hypothetical protein
MNDIISPVLDNLDDSPDERLKQELIQSVRRNDQIRQHLWIKQLPLLCLWSNFERQNTIFIFVERGLPTLSDDEFAMRLNHRDENLKRKGQVLLEKVVTETINKWSEEWGCFAFDLIKDDIIWFTDQLAEEIADRYRYGREEVNIADEMVEVFIRWMKEFGAPRAVHTELLC